MLISHRVAAYVDNVELERCAGMLEIRAKTDPSCGEVYMAAACALRVLQTQDVKEAKDFIPFFEAALDLEGI